MLKAVIRDSRCRSSTLSYYACRLWYHYDFPFRTQFTISTLPLYSCFTHNSSLFFASTSSPFHCLAQTVIKLVFLRLWLHVLAFYATPRSATTVRSAVWQHCTVGSAFGSLTRWQFALEDLNWQVVWPGHSAIRYVTLNTNILHKTFVCWLMLRHVSALLVVLSFAYVMSLHWKCTTLETFILICWAWRHVKCRDWAKSFLGCWG